MPTGDDYQRAFGSGRVSRERQRAAEQALDATPLRQASPESNSGGAKINIMFTRSYDGWNVGYAWLKQLAVNEDSILRREGQHDLALFDALLDDPVVFASFQQRQLAVVARPWEVEAGDDKDPRSVRAADHLREQLNELGWDRICYFMLFARWFGFGVAEAIWSIGDDGLIRLADIIVPDRRWFAFTNEGELRMRSPEDPNGVAVPPNKFWAIRTGGTHDFVAYGTGLAHWCYWPVWFKKNGIKFWALFLEKFGMPTTVGLLPAGTGEDDPIVDQVLDAAKAVGRDSAVVVNGVQAQDGKLTSPLETIEASRSGSGASSYSEFVEMLNDELLRVILGQTMTSKAAAGGIGSNQSDTQKDVRDEIVRADSDMLHESFNRTISRWVTGWNFGPDVAPPRVYRNMDDAEDLGELATRDVALYGIGIRRTEQSVKETYGDGYELHDVEAEKAEREAAAAERVAAAGQAQRAGRQDGNVIDLAKAKAKRAAFAATDPEPLYVYRRLLNADKLVAWAKAQGFKTALDPADMHVTVLYSKAPVDWFKMDDGWCGGDGKLEVAGGGARKVDRLGDGGAVVLFFASSEITWRHDSMVERGASHDFPEFHPHVTFTYDPGDVDLEKVEPFVGELHFGPEMFEPINSDWSPSTVEFSSDDLDAIDRLAVALADEASPVFNAMAEQLRVDLKGVKTAEGLRVALLDSLERLPTERLAILGALPTLAARAAAAVGVDDRVTA